MVPVSLVSKKNSRDNNRDTMNNSRDSNSCSRENSQPLQSVALVSEVMQNQQQHQQQLSKDDGGSPVLKPVLRKQYSNSSIHSSGSAGATAKGPPPPYKQPPPPPAAPAGFGGPNVSPNSSGSNRLNTNCDPSSAGGSSTYANVQIRHHHPSNFFYLCHVCFEPRIIFDFSFYLQNFLSNFTSTINVCGYVRQFNHFSWTRHFTAKKAQSSHLGLHATIY